MSQRILHYDPHSQQQRRGLRIRSDEWMKYQSTLKQLWMFENKSLGDVRKIMAEQHGFNASKSQYTRQFEKWSWQKKTSAKAMKSVVRSAAQERDANRPISLQGRGVSHEKRARFIQRHPSSDPTSSPTPSINLRSGMDFQAMAAMKSPPEVVGEPIKELNNIAEHGEIPCEHYLPVGTDQFLESDFKTISLLCEPGTVVVDDGGLETREKVAPFQLLPQVYPLDPVGRDCLCRKGYKCGVSALLLEKSSQALSLWDGERPFDDGEPPLCPQHQETPLPVPPHSGPHCVLYFCCNCGDGPHLWKIHPQCPNCQAWRCSRCIQTKAEW